MPLLPVFLDLSPAQFSALRSLCSDLGLDVDDAVSSLVAAGLRVGPAVLLASVDVPLRVPVS